MRSSSSAPAPFDSNLFLMQTTTMSLRVRGVPMNADGTEQVDLFLMDHGGQSALNQSDYGMSLWREAEGAMLVFDLTEAESLRSVAKWQRRLQDSRPGERIPVVLVGNKSDLTDDGRRSVRKEDAVELAR